MKSLKSKLILTFSLFIVVLMTVTAFLQVQEKKKELTDDIFKGALSYAELTAARILDDYKLYLVPKSFIYFNREIRDLLAKNEDIASIQLIDFEGNLLFDSETEQTEQYSGEIRTISDSRILAALISKNPFVFVNESARTVFFQKKEGNFVPVDQYEKAVEGLKSGETIQYVVYPIGESYFLIYEVTYQALEQRVAETQFRILLLAVFGVGLGVLLAIIFGSSITKPLQVLKRGAEILATGDLTYRVQVKTKDETFILAQSFNKMAEELLESTKALVYKERVAKELELAKSIQQKIIPKNLPKVKGLDLAAGIIPAEEIGGDCYDFLRSENGQLMFYLGDVTGHGVPSGIVVSIANAVFYTMSNKNLPLDQVIVEVNEVLKAKTTSSMFITLVLLRWDENTQKMQYVSAGHEQIIHYKAAQNEVELLPSGGLALGMIKDIKKTLTVREIELAEGDVLVLYSDGIPEAWRNAKEMYGMTRFKQMVKQYAKFDRALAIRNALLTDVYMFRQGYKQMDDITSIVVKRTA